MRRVLNWLDDRTSYRKMLELALEEPVHGGVRWAYVFGSVLTFIFLLQAVTGVLLALYYSPSVSTAWASVAYIQDQVTMGWFVRGLHHYGASAMVIVTGLHMFQVAVYGAYKNPREMNWLVGVAMLGLVLAFALTGYLLPWDQKGYWATKVATQIMGSAPLLGPWVKQLVQGGNEYGNLTLTRFFAVHVFLLPAGLMVLLLGHILLFRKHGVTPKWGLTDEELHRRTRPFWPDQLFRDAAAMAAVFAILVAATIATNGAPLFGPADPGSNFEARPEWYFLPLFQLLKYVRGPLELLVSFGLPVVIVAVLVALPFWDRNADRSPWTRRSYLGLLFVGVLGGALLMLQALRDDASNPNFRANMEKAEAVAKQARKLAKQGVPPAGGVAVFENEPTFKAQKIFADRCASCHVGNDRKGPALESGYNSRKWIAAFLRNPDGDLFFGRTKALHKMKPVKETGDDLLGLVEFVYAQTGAADASATLIAKGRTLFENGSCIDCHSDDGETADDEGPNLGKRGTREWFVAFLKDPSHGRFFGERNEMPGYADKLSDEELLGVADYLVSLRADLP